MNISAETRPWLAQYPQGVPADLGSIPYASMVDLLEESFGKFANLPACSFLGADMTYGEWDETSRRMAAYLQSLDLQRGDRVAVMMPNIPQYMIAMAAILRAGLVLVNVNPLYTARELEHQLKDSGAKAIFIVDNFAHTLQQCVAHTDVKHIILATFGDRLGTLKGMIVNLVLRHVKKLVPAYSLPGAVGFNDALGKLPASAWQRPQLSLDDIAVLQYTGGTTGVAKGAVLLHRNILSNALQCDLWYQPGLQAKPIDGQANFVCALPLYHIFAFTANLLLCAKLGGKSILLPNPRDLPSVFKELRKHKFHSFPAVNTLFNALAHHPDFNTVDWSHLRISVGGGMAVQSAVAQLWLEKTGCPICEGYGLSETSPVATCNPVTLTQYTGSIGIPVPSTYVKLVDDKDQEVTTLGERGEIAIKGPQVMAGYWQRPEETAKVMTADGYFKTGDIGTMDEKGYFTIVDRKKDMILVSGFNVYPSEVEEVVSAVPGVLECAAVGVPDENAGEAVKVFVVRKPGSTVTEEDIKTHAKSNLTGYKRPRIIEFRETPLPKTNVGKILRRELREEEMAKEAA